MLAGPDRRGFCAVRPPGHHSNAGRASGFCLYNQIAVGARHALAVHRLGRVAVVGEPLCGTPAYAYSTVTLLARLRGWSTSVPLSTAT
ncbi:MAG: hypothetical protein JNL89_01585 [Rhodanobacteraceae bacterium]|nr:hypothetical protein [Rhodanobacteraceae bacterium]